MAVKRFLLNTSQLNDATYGLDGGQAFILDSSQLNGTRVLDGAEFLTTATGAATLGLMSATATVSVAHSVTATANLGGLIAETAEVIVTTEATATSVFGALTSSGSATVTHSATLTANLGAIVASVVTAVEQEAVATATFGGLTASVQSVPTPPAPAPEPTPSGGRRIYAQPRRKKIEPTPEVETPVVVIEPKRRYAVTSTNLGTMKAQAESTITFSILDDDAEVLLLV